MELVSSFDFCIFWMLYTYGISFCTLLLLLEMLLGHLSSLFEWWIGDNSISSKFGTNNVILPLFECTRRVDTAVGRLTTRKSVDPFRDYHCNWTQQYHGYLCRYHGSTQMCVPGCCIVLVMPNTSDSFNLFYHHFQFAFYLLLWFSIADFSGEWGFQFACFDNGPINLFYCKFAGISNLKGDGIEWIDFNDWKHMLTAIKIELEFHGYSMVFFHIT